MPPKSSAPNRHLLASNATPIFGWLFTLGWLAVVALGTQVYIWSPLRGEWPYGDAVLASFWAFGMGAAVFFLRIPRTTVHRDGLDIVVTERWLCASREHRCPHVEAGHVTLAEAADSDGDPYFSCRLTTPSGRVITIAEGHQRDLIDEARRMVLATPSTRTRAR